MTLPYSLLMNLMLYENNKTTNLLLEQAELGAFFKYAESE
jgi:hypothetical protein